MVCKTSGTGRNRPWLVFRESFKQNAYSGSRKGMIGNKLNGFSGYGFPLAEPTPGGNRLQAPQRNSRNPTLEIVIG